MAADLGGGSPGMSKKLEMPTPPSATGTVTWLISSTSPAWSMAPMKTAAQLAKGNVQVHFLLAAEEVGDASGLEVRQVIVTDTIGDKQDHMIAVHFVLLETQNAFRIHTDRQSFGIFVGDVVPTNDRFLGAGQFHVSPGKFLHRGRAHKPGADAEAGRSGFEERGASLQPGSLPQRSPRILPSIVVHMWQIT